MQVVDEDTRRVLAALDVEGEDGAGAVREVLLVQLVVAAPSMDGCETDSTSGTVCRYSTTFSAFCTWRSTRSDRVSVPLQQQERGERGQGGTGVAQQDGADAGHEGGSTKAS